MKLLQTKFFKLLVLIILSSSMIFKSYARSKEMFVLGDRGSKANDMIKAIRAKYQFKNEVRNDKRKKEIRRQEIAELKTILKNKELRKKEYNLKQNIKTKLETERKHYLAEINRIKEEILLRNKTTNLPQNKEAQLTLLSQKKIVTEEIEELSIKIKEAESNSNLYSEENYEETIKYLKEEDKGLNDDIKSMDSILKGNQGDIIALAIAGKENREALAFSMVGNDKWKGFLNGATVRIASSSGDAIGKIVDKYSFRIFGGVVEGAENIWNWVWRKAFHNSRKPFTLPEINSWKKLISSDLREIEIMIKNAEKYSSRSREEILRELENDVINYEEEALNLWKDFIEDIAFTFEELAEEINNRKGYYKNNSTGFGIYNCSSRLQNKLIKTRNWLINSQSVKDFAALTESKLIVPAMKKSIENYFDNLSNQIKPLYASSNKSSLRSNSYKKDKYSDGYSSSIPDYFM